MTREERIKAIIDKRRELGAYRIKHPLGFYSGESVKMPRQLLRDGINKEFFLYLSAHLIGDIRPFDKESTAEFFGDSLQKVKRLVKQGVDKGFVDITVGHALVIKYDERIRISDDYIYIDEFVLGLDDLSTTAKIFYAFIKGFGEQFTGGTKFIEDNIGYSKATTHRSIVELKELGLINVELKRDGSKKIRIITFN